MSGPEWVLTSPRPLSAQMVENIKRQWQILFDGPDVGNKLLVLEDGLKLERVGDVRHRCAYCGRRDNQSDTCAGCGAPAQQRQRIPL